MLEKTKIQTPQELESDESRAANVARFNELCSIISKRAEERGLDEQKLMEILSD